MPSRRAISLVCRGLVKPHHLIPLIQSSMVVAVCRIVVITILFCNAVIPLILERCEHASEIKIGSQPALAPDLDGLVNFVVAGIGECVAAKKDGGQRSEIRDQRINDGW